MKGGPLQAKKNITVETRGAEADSKGLQVRHVELAAELNFNEGLHVKVSAHALPKAGSEALRGSPRFVHVFLQVCFDVESWPRNSSKCWIS